MNLDGLKTLTEDFDPAKLLPELDTMLGKMELLARILVIIGPVILLVLGLIYFLLPPKEANHYFGYRCWFGMGSVDAWRFTQRLAGIVWSVLGLVLVIVMLIVSGGFAGKEVMELLGAAMKCVIWEAALIAAACLFINAIVALRFNSKGERRKIE